MWLLYISMLNTGRDSTSMHKIVFEGFLFGFFRNIYMHHLISRLVVYIEDWVSQAFMIFSSENPLDNFTRFQCKKKIHNEKNNKPKSLIPAI